MSRHCVKLKKDKKLQKKSSLLAPKVTRRHDNDYKISLLSIFFLFNCINKNEPIIKDFQKCPVIGQDQKYQNQNHI